MRAEFRQNQNNLRKALLADARDARAARLAWLALEGLKFQTHLHFHDWTETERTEILRDIEMFAALGYLAAPVEKTEVAHD